MAITEDALRRILGPLARRVSLMVSRVVLRNVDDAHDRQEAQVEGYADELHPRVENFQPFGLRGVPPPGSEGIGIAVGGERNHLLVVGMGPKQRPLTPLDVGDVLFYCVDPDTYARLKANGAAWMQGGKSLTHTLAGLNQYITMAPGITILYVEDKADPSKASRITITPTTVRIETENFIHP